MVFSVDYFIGLLIWNAFHTHTPSVIWMYRDAEGKKISYIYIIYKASVKNEWPISSVLLCLIKDRIRDIKNLLANWILRYVAVERPYLFLGAFSPYFPAFCAIKYIFHLKISSWLKYSTDTSALQSSTVLFIHIHKSVIKNTFHIPIIPSTRRRRIV